MTTVLIFAAHPDDEWLGVGGTILRHVAAGDAVTIHLDGLCRQPDWSKAVAVAHAAGAIFAVEEPTEPSDIIYTHHTGDLNADHRRVAERALVVGRFARAVRTFETVSSTEWGLAPFAPTYFVGIDLAAKLALLRIYDDEMREFPHPRSFAALDALARLRGSTVGVEAAEAFVTVRERW